MTPENISTECWSAGLNIEYPTLSFGSSTTEFSGSSSKIFKYNVTGTEKIRLWIFSFRSLPISQCSFLNSLWTWHPCSHWQTDISWQWADLRWLDLRWLEHRKYIHSKCLHLYIIRRVWKWENVCLYLFWCAMHNNTFLWQGINIRHIMTSLWRLDIVNISAPARAPPVTVIPPAHLTSHISNTTFIFNEQFIWLRRDISPALIKYIWWDLLISLNTSCPMGTTNIISFFIPPHMLNKFFSNYSLA